jgi:phosphate transport system permease protein
MSTTSTPAQQSFVTGKPGLMALRKTSRPGEKVVLGVFRIASLLTVLITVAILIALAIPSISFFAQVPVFDFLFGTR